MSLLDELLDETVDQAAAEVRQLHGLDSGDPVWREHPASFDDFCRSERHLNLPPLFPRQRAAITALLGDDPKAIFEEPAPPEDRPLSWRKFAKSSNVAAVAWSLDHGVVVEFTDGSCYAYRDAPKAHVAAMVKAPSPGKYVAQVLRRNAVGERLTTPASELCDRIYSPASRSYQLAVLLWGKGSGKDYICSVVVTYLIHVLLCLRDPQAYFELAPGENIDVVNVAYNADQAKRVFFEKFKQRLFRWTWLRENFDVFEGGRRKWKETAGRGETWRVDINDGEVLFPRMIRCFSRHAENESYEGLNVIAWIMDEASAFLTKTKKENAGKIYQTLRTSAGSRFQRRWVGFIISYPRHADDFTCTKVAEARAHPEAGIYADGPAATWDVNRMLGRGEWVEVRPGHKVPVELANDFILDFEEALAKYECLPPKAKDALIKQPERLWAAVQKGRKPVIEWEPIETTRTVVDGDGNEQTRRFAGIKLTRLGKMPKGTKVFMHGDPAEVNDAFGLGFAHGVPATIMQHVPAGEVLTAAQLEQANAGELERAAAEGRPPRLIDATTPVPWEKDVVRTVVDALLVWRPDPRRNMNVDLLNVKEVMLAILDKLGAMGGRLGGGSFDKWESAETVQLLQARKLPVENEAWSNPFQHRIYRGARSGFYNDLITLPDTPSITSVDPRAPGAIYELERVEEIEGHKIDHPEDGSKDLADVIVRLHEWVSGQDTKRLSFATVGQRNAPPPGQEGRVRSSDPVVNPRRTASPATQPRREAEAKRAAERPEAVIVEGAGVEAPVRQGRLAFGSGTRRS